MYLLHNYCIWISVPLFCGCKQSCKKHTSNWVKRSREENREEDSVFCLSVNRLTLLVSCRSQFRASVRRRQTDGDCWEVKESELMTSSFASVLVLMSFQGERKSTSPRMWRSGRLPRRALCLLTLREPPTPAAKRETETERETSVHLPARLSLSLRMTVGGSAAFFHS